MKIIINRLYKILFNFSGRKHGISTQTHVVASALFSLLLLLIIMAVGIIIKLIAHEHWYHKQNKGLASLIILSFMAFTYFFLFNVLGFEKMSNEEDGLFHLEKHVSKQTHVFLFSILAITVILFGYYLAFF